MKEVALYVQDQITKGNWSVNLGIRGDLYNGLVIARQSRASPWGCLQYQEDRTRFFAFPMRRTLESPFNENLIVSSTGCQSAVLSTLSLA